MLEAIEIVPSRVRGAAIAAACVGGVFLMFISPLALIFSTPLILGTLVQPRLPRSGRLLMWLGAWILSWPTLFFSVRVVLEAIHQFNRMAATRGIGYFEPIRVTIFVVSVATIILVIWCDVELVLEAIKSRRTALIIEPPTSLIGEGVAWLAAICLSAWAFSGILRNLRTDWVLSSYLINNAYSLSIGLAVIAFDVWLAARATKWRTRS